MLPSRHKFYMWSLTKKSKLIKWGKHTLIIIYLPVYLQPPPLFELFKVGIFSWPNITITSPPAKKKINPKTRRRLQRHPRTEPIAAIVKCQNTITDKIIHCECSSCHKSSHFSFSLFKSEIVIDWTHFIYLFTIIANWYLTWMINFKNQIFVGLNPRNLRKVFPSLTLEDSSSKLQWWLYPRAQ